MTIQKVPTKGEFYLMHPDTRGEGGGHGVVLTNTEDVPLPQSLRLAMGSGGLKALEVIAQLRLDAGKGDLSLDLLGGFKGYWPVSDSLKKLLESVDPQAALFTRCNVIQEDGWQGQARYLCEVVRTLDAIDEGASNVQVRTIPTASITAWQAVQGLRSIIT